MKALFTTLFAVLSLAACSQSSDSKAVAQPGAKQEPQPQTSAADTGRADAAVKDRAEELLGTWISDCKTTISGQSSAKMKVTLNVDRTAVAVVDVYAAKDCSGPLAGNEKTMTGTYTAKLDQNGDGKILLLFPETKEYPGAKTMQKLKLQDSNNLATHTLAMAIVKDGKFVPVKPDELQDMNFTRAAE